MVFFVLNIIEALGVVLMFKPFMAEKNEKPRQNGYSDVNKHVII